VVDVHEPVNERDTPMTCGERTLQAHERWRRKGQDQVGPRQARQCEVEPFQRTPWEGLASLVEPDSDKAAKAKTAYG
jgi:hypothetical protein